MNDDELFDDDEYAPVDSATSACLIGLCAAIVCGIVAIAAKVFA